MSALFILAIGIITIINAQTSIDCNSNIQCIDQEITRSQITCGGRSACWQSNLTSTNKPSGFIKCSGVSACLATGYIQAASTVSCTGVHSCQSSGPINARSLECLSPYSCRSSWPSADGPYSSDTNIFCNAATSCWDSGLRAGKKTICDGYLACQEANIQGGLTANCNGQASCQSAKLIANRKLVCCSGSESCQLATVKNTKEFRSYGYQSGMSTIVNSVPTIKGYGAESLRGAVIDSDDEEEMSVQMFGYQAGFGATVTCRSGATCNLACKGDACEDLDYQCENGATCNVSPDGCLIEGTTDVNGVICPSITFTSFWDNGPAIKALQMGNDERNARKTQKQMDKDKQLDEVLLEPYGGVTACLNEISCIGEKIVVGDGIWTYCSGSKSCLNTNITVKDGGTIACFGEDSCQNSSIDTSGGRGVALCYGEASCAYSTFSGARIACWATQSCAGSTVNADGNTDGYSGYMNCDGDESCKGASISVGYEINCEGSRGCADAYLETNDYVECDGSYSCVGATVAATYGSNCYGKYSCSKAELYGYRVEAQAWFSAARSTMYPSWVPAYGYKSLYLSTIVSTYASLYVYAYGHQAGDGATVICNGASSCTVRCKGSGCDNMDYICVDGATCNVVPPKCDGTRNKYEGIDCPNLSTVTDYKEAEEFLRKKEMRNKELIEMFDEYIDGVMDGLYDDGEMEYEFEDFFRDELNLLLGKDEVNGLEAFDGDLVGLVSGKEDMSGNMRLGVGIGCVSFVVVSVFYIWYKMKYGLGKYEYIQPLL